MEVLDAIEKRRSYRGKYRPEPVPRALLTQIMQAGLQAPSGCNKQTVSLIGIDEPELLHRLLAVMSPPVCPTAPAMILVLSKKRIAYTDGFGKARCYAVQDYAAAIENMMLAATGLGLATCWIEGHITDADAQGRRMAEMLGVPAEYEAVCALPLGYPAEECKPPYQREFAKRAWFNGFQTE